MAAWVSSVAAIVPMQVAVLSEVRGRDHSLSAGAPPTEEMRSVIKWAPPAATVGLVGHQQQLPGDKAEKRGRTKQKEDTGAPPDTAVRGLELLCSMLDLIFSPFESMFHSDARWSLAPLA